MRTSWSLVVLAGLSLSVHANGAALTYQNEYTKACNLAAEAGKPVVVILAGEKSGYREVVEGRRFNDEVSNLLNSKYVTVVVNTETEAGQRLAKLFEMPATGGVIISDHEARLQAFRHEGNLEVSDMAGRLHRHADPKMVVVTTETTTPVVMTAAPTPVVSTPLMIAPPAPAMTQYPVMSAPTYYPSYPTFPTMKSSCPNGNCPNARMIYSR